jgi:hypothetical protein
MKIYEITVNKIVLITDKNYKAEEEARLDGARMKNQLQAQDPNHEYWFDYKEIEG